MSRSMRIVGLAFLALGYAAACRPQQDLAPIGSEIATPAALALLQSGGNLYLLVSNANFQLQYQSGSLQAIDLGAVDYGRGLNYAEPLTASSVVLPSFSGPIVFTSGGKTALVSNRYSDTSDQEAVPDRVYFVDVGNPHALALKTIRPDDPTQLNSLKAGLGPFGMAVVNLPPLGPGRPRRDRAFVADQVDGGISVLNLTPGTYCPSNEPSPCLDDGTPVAGATAPTFTTAGTSAALTFSGPAVTPYITRTQHWTVTFVEEPNVCVASPQNTPEGAWRVVSSAIGVEQSLACTGQTYVTDDGVIFTISEVLNSAGDPVPGGFPTSGDTYRFDTFYGDLGLDRSEINLNVNIPGATISGVGIGQLLYDPFRRRLYGTSRLTNFIYVVDPDSMTLLGVFTVTSNVGGRDSRGMALSPDGKVLYVTNKGPDSLLLLNPDALQPNGSLVPQVVVDAQFDSIHLGNGPSQLALSSDGRYAFVTEFDDGAVEAVDLLTRRPLGESNLPHFVNPGPFDILLAPGGKKAFVANYFSSSIDVIDTDPTSPTFMRVLTTIADSNYTTQSQ